MKRLNTGLSATIVLLITSITFFTAYRQPEKNFLSIEVQNNSTHILTINGFTFRDLNKNGKMDVYEDVRQPIEARISDLLSQMSIEEKAAMMFINGARINDDATIDDKPGKGMF